MRAKTFNTRIGTWTSNPDSPPDDNSRAPCSPSLHQRQRKTKEHSHLKYASVLDAWVEVTSPKTIKRRYTCLTYGCRHSTRLHIEWRQELVEATRSDFATADAHTDAHNATFFASTWLTIASSGTIPVLCPAWEPQTEMLLLEDMKSWWEEQKTNSLVRKLSLIGAQ